MICYWTNIVIENYVKLNFLHYMLTPSLSVKEEADLENRGFKTKTNFLTKKKESLGDIKHFELLKWKWAILLYDPTKTIQKSTIKPNNDPLLFG